MRLAKIMLYMEKYNAGDTGYGMRLAKIMLYTAQKMIVPTASV